MKKISITLFILVLISCSRIEHQTEVVQDEGSIPSKTWNEMISGLHSETEQALFMAMMRVKVERENNIDGKGLILEGESLIHQKEMNLRDEFDVNQWKLSFTNENLIEQFVEQGLQLFIYCRGKQECQLLRKKMYSTGLKRSSVAIFDIERIDFKDKFKAWVIKYPSHLYLAHKRKSLNNFLNSIRSPELKEKLRKSLSSNFVFIPNARGRINNWLALNKS